MKRDKESYYKRDKVVALEQADRNYIKYMCKTGCKFFIDGACSLKRIIKICARKGLKNRE